MQLSDGGWGWFSGFGEHSSPHTTALVVHGLQIARQNDVALPEGMLERGIAWLTSYQAKQVQLLENGISEVKPYKKSADDLDALVFMVLADAGVRNDAMLDFLDRDRTHLSVYAKAMFGLALEKLGEKDKLAMILQNIGQFVVQDDENQTAYLKLPNEGYWWCWYGSEIETDAFYLKLLARTDPKGELAPRLVKYLLNNRKHATYWNSTRDTAFCIEAMADFLKASGEDRPDMTVEIALDGKKHKEVKITPADLFSFDNTFVLEGNDGRRRARTPSRSSSKGKGPLYFNAYLTNFTLEDPITRAGLEVKVNRKFYKLIRDDKTVDVAGGRGQAVGQKVESYRREPLADGADARRAATWSRSSSRSTARTTTSTWCSRTSRRPASSRSRCAAATTATTWAPTSSSATSAWPSSPARWPAASTASPTACGPRSPASSTPCPPAPRRCTPPSCANSDEIQLRVED